MSAVLGISGYYHDAAAALVIDGQLVAAQQEERLSRKKNDPGLPFLAARACLQLGRISARQLDAVVYYEDPYAKLERVLLHLLRTAPRSWRSFPRALASQLGKKLWVLDELASFLGVERRRVEFVSHHESHAASAFFVSPYDEAAVLVVDAVGEDVSTSLWRGRGTKLERLASIAYPHSLGLFYAALTAYLGFEVNEGEYKVMGLAAHGTPRLVDTVRKLLKVDDDGGFTLALRYFDSFVHADRAYGRALEELLGPARSPRAPWDLGTEADRRYADVAFAVQHLTEEVLVRLARRARALTGCDSLCLAGGVSLNAVANRRILREAGFARVFVQPAAGDAGGAVGAAILGALQRGAGRPRPLVSTALGIEPSAADALEVGQRLGLRARRVERPAEEAAAAVAQGQIVAWATGRCELGPRALGQRSLLADARPLSSRERLNRVIKQREPFRPFAPAVLASRAGDYFVDSDNDMTPFMTTICDVAPGAGLEAVTHVDGTARLQRVGTENPLHALLGHYASVTGTPVVLNTSLNGRGEPIVGSATDALAFFAQHAADVLFVEDVRVERPG